MANHDECQSETIIALKSVFNDKVKLERLKNTIHEQVSTALQTALLDKKMKVEEYCYNEEGEEEEDYGFKKKYFFNNEEFYARDNKTVNE